MAQQDLVQKTRFEKQIPFPILSSIAAEVKRLEVEFPEQGIDLSIQYEALNKLTADLDEVAAYVVNREDKDKLILLIAEAIRTVKYIDKHYI